MAPRRARKPRNRSHPLADKIFPTILRNVAPTERPYPFLKRNLKAFAPDQRSLTKRKEWELDLFCSKRDSEEDLLLACRVDRELILNIRSAWLCPDGAPEKKFAVTANLRLQVERYPERPDQAPDQPGWMNYGYVYDGELTWLSDGTFENNPGDIRITSSARSKNVKTEMVVWLSIRNQEVQEAEPADATDSQDSQADSLAFWKMKEGDGLVVVTESGSLRSCDGPVKLKNGKVPGWTMLLDVDLRWKPTYRRHIQPLSPNIRHPDAETWVRSGNRATFNIIIGEDDRVAFMRGWCCPLCVPPALHCINYPPGLNYGSWLRLRHHIEREHPDVTAEPGNLWDIEIRERRREAEEVLDPVSTSSRLELGTLADRLPELMEGYNGGDFEHLIREREEIIFGWIHFTGKRRFLLCMWNRWVAEKGPLLIHSGRKYVCDWIERDRHRLIKYDLGVELRDHLMIMVEYKHIDSMTVLMALRKLKDPPVN